MNLKIFSGFHKLQSTSLKLKFCHLIQGHPLKYGSVFYGLYQLSHVTHVTREQFQLMMLLPLIMIIKTTLVFVV